jgi:hypothetical protein
MPGRGGGKCMKKQWVSIGGYRGYYKPIPPQGYELLLDCSVVNEAGEQLKKIVTAWLRDKHIKYRAGYLRSSNVFASHFYMLIEANRVPRDVREAIENWFIDQNNGTFSIFSGESWELDTRKAQEEWKTICDSTTDTLLV